jgi:predicted methyltransferase
MKLLVTTALLALAAPLAAHAQTVSPAIRAALADSGRPAADSARDAARHPGEILAFTGVKPGDKVADFIMGGGYWTRILAKTVGPDGRVFAYQPAEFIRFNPKYGEDMKALGAAYPNVVPLSESLGAFAFAEPLDAIITVQNYHDLHLAQSPPGLAGEVVKRLYAALKPGGTLLVIDHVAAADPGFAVPQKLHRIDPAAARKEIEAAGFRFDGQLPILANPADPHTASVFDAALKGKTDQFVFRFRKPA